MKRNKRKVFAFLLTLALVFAAVSSNITVSAAGEKGDGGQRKPGETTTSNPSSISVYWDTVSVNGTALTGRNSQTGVESVTMDNVAVTHGDSSGRVALSGGTTYTMTYNTAATAQVSVTPANGYHVTFISINCIDSSGVATACETYANGGAFTKYFSISDVGTVTVNVSLDNTSGFHHTSESNTYFILVGVAPVPTPLIVTYDYGEIQTALGEAFSETVFADDSKWTVANQNNQLGIGSITKQYTEFTYAYSHALSEEGQIEAVKAWLHYANALSDEAIATAASAGYVFTGWKAVYANDYGVAEYSVGDKVALYTDVTLIAQWEPTELTVTKNVIGLTDEKEVAYTLEVYQLVDADTDSWTLYDTVELTVSGNGSASKTLTAVPTGTYKVEETGSYDYEDGKVFMANTAQISDPVTLDLSHIKATLAVTNTYNAATSLTIEKVWEDADDQDGIRPESIVVNIINRETKEVIQSGVEISASEDWTVTVAGLPLYDEEGQVIAYAVEEGDVEGYVTSYQMNEDGSIIITNTHEVETTTIAGEKIWDDADNQDGIRPESITIHLYADETEVASTEVTADENGDWSYSFTDLPVYRDGGVEISYTISEDAVKGYETTVDGYHVTNSHTPEQTSVTVMKAWDDSDDADGIRPEEVIVVLVVNGAATEKQITLSEENNWTATFTELDVYTAGVENIYTIEEVAVEGYTTSIAGDAATAYVITNTHTIVADQETPADDKETPAAVEETTADTKVTTAAAEATTEAAKATTAAAEATTAAAAATPAAQEKTSAASEAVQTGDNSHILLWTGLLVISLLGLAGTVIYKKKMFKK